MGYLVAVILFFTGFIMKKKRHTLVAPEVLFCYFWALISLAASARLFGLVDVNSKTWMMILIGTLSFVVGCQLKLSFNSNRKYVPRVSEQYGFISEKNFWILTIIIFVLLIRQFLVTLSLLNEGYTMVAIRAGIDQEIVSRYNLYGGLEIIIFDYIKSAFEMILMVSGIELYFLEVKRKRAYLGVSISLAFLSAFSDGGRWIIIYFVVDFVVCYFLFKRLNRTKKIDMSQKKIVSIIMVMIIMLAMISSVTKSRMVGNTLEHFYSYLCCCVPLLDIKSLIITKQGMISGFMASQWGIWSLIVPLFQKFFDITPTFYNRVAEFAIIGQKNEFIGTGYYNAFVSAFYYLYVDFRWIGVVCGMIIFGVIAKKTYDYALTISKGGSCVPYLVICQLIIKSNQNYLFTSSEYIIIFIILLFLWKRRIRIQYK